MTIYVFDEELSAATSFADGDVILVHDTSAGTKKYLTAALVRSQLDAGIVSTTATTLTVTATQHAGKTIHVASASPIAVTLPQATGTGNKYRFVLSVAATGTSHTISVANATDDFNGSLAIYDSSETAPAGTVIGFAATATDDRISLNGTTKAGTVGTVVEIVDVTTGLFSAFVRGAATGSYATPFDANVS